MEITKDKVVSLKEELSKIINLSVVYKLNNEDGEYLHLEKVLEESKKHNEEYLSSDLYKFLITLPTGNIEIIYVLQRFGCVLLVPDEKLLGKEEVWEKLFSYYKTIDKYDRDSMISLIYENRFKLSRALYEVVSVLEL